MTSSRSVLQLVPSFGGGGAETQLAYLCAGLVERGWRVEVAHLTAGPNAERFRASGAAIHELAARGNHDPTLLCSIRRAIRELGPDLVQTWIPMMDVLGGIAARLQRVPWLLSERSSPMMFPSSLKLRVRELVARGASAVVSNSASGDAYWGGVLPARVRRAVIGNAVPHAEIEAARPAAVLGFGLDDARPLILYLGRFNAGKNVAILVDALARVVAETDAVALLCGVGPELDVIRARIARAGIAERVVAPGFVEQRFELLKRASLAVSLSRYEGMPNAVMEAAAAGCPQLLSEIPAHRALLDDASALFVGADSAAAAAEAMIGILRDPAAAGARAAAARQRARAWSVAELAASYERIYCEVLERGVRAR